MLFGYKATSEDYVNYLRSIGALIGSNCTIYCPRDTTIDILNPHLLTIGDNVKITGPTTILTHDYSICVLNHLDNKIYGKQRKTKIGNNVFLGWGCTILCGSEIGDNTIIGAGSVVSGKIEENAVYAGNPLKKICNLDDYRKKIQSMQLVDAKKIYNEYKDRFKITPPIEVFHEYFYLFSNSEEELVEKFKNKIKEEGISFYNMNPNFKNFDEFCKYCENDKND